MRYQNLIHSVLTFSAISLAGCAAMDRPQYSGMAAEARAPVDSSAVAGANPTLAAASTGSMPSTNSMQSGGNDLFPPNARPGHCYARVLVPARFETVSERITKREAGSRIEVTPARYESATDKVVVREASSKLEVIPAEYETVEERVMVRPASKKIVEVPAKYRTVTEKVLDKPAHTAWKRSSGPIDGALQTSVDQSTGEVLCLVEEPASYKTISKTVLASPPTTQEVEIPAEYKTIKRRVVKRPAQTRSVEIPAEYKTVTVQRLAQPAQTKRIDVPAEYATVERRKKISEESLAWREVLCDVNMTAKVVSSLQTKLKQAGFYRGPIDGQFGRGTLSAANRFAAKRNLPTGTNYVAMETVKGLGVSL